MSKKKILFQDPDEQYIGNIWGWKNSFIALGILVFFGALFLYRLYTAPVQVPKESPTQTITTTEVDSLVSNKDTLQ